MISDGALRSAGLLWVLWLSPPLAAEGVREVRIDQPDGFWQRNYSALVPSIRLPTSHAGDDLIRVWMRLPEGRKVDVRYLPEQARYTLVFPPGTRSDRVEYLATKDAEGNPVRTVMDVRGTTIEADGSQRFHILRPLGAEIHAPLAGWSWPRGDQTAQRTVDASLKRLVQQVRRPGDKPPMEAGEAQTMVEFNQCGSCHQPNQERARFTSDRSLERATDAMGFFVPHAVVQDHCVVANHRPRDLNSEDPFVEVSCDSGPATLRSTNGYERYVCPGRGVPMGSRDVRAALEAGQDYTERVCASRRYLYEHMTDRARTAYADAFQICDIPSAAGAPE